MHRLLLCKISLLFHRCLLVRKMASYSAVPHTVPKYAFEMLRSTVDGETSGGKGGTHAGGRKGDPLWKSAHMMLGITNLLLPKEA